MTTTARKIRVGLIGAGGIAGAHVKGYLENQDTTELVAVADPVAASAARRAEPTGAATYSSQADLLREAEIDAVDICLPHHLHKDAIVAAADAGKHVLCEKPLCLTEEEAREVQAAVERNGVTLMCAHNQLFSPPVAKAVELVRAGLLGQVYEVRTTDSFFNDFNPENMGWRASAATSGGGELIDTGYHPTYLMLELAGAEPTEVAAMLSTHRLRFMEGEDSAQVLVRFANGVLGTLTTSWAYTPSSNTERFSVVGEKGSLFSDGLNLSYSLRSGERARLEFPPVNEFAAEIASFARCLLDRTRPHHTEKEGIEVLGIILAAYESAATHTFASVRSARSAALA